MSHSVARAVATRGTGLLLLCLVVLGASTATALHVQALRALDRALLTAAHGHAHPEVPGEWEVEHSRPPVEVWIVGDADVRVPTPLARQAQGREGATFSYLGPTRLVLLPVELAGEPRLLVAAAAPRVTPVVSVGPFTVTYALLAVCVALAARVALGATVRHAFRPLARAREEASQVLGLAAGARLTEEGPDEVRALIAAVNGLLDRLDAAGRAQGRFTAEAAHELRTPVTAMLGSLDVALRRSPDAATDRAALQAVREDTARLSRLVQGLTALARLDAGQAHHAREPVRAGELAEAALAAEQEELRSAGCTAQLSMEADPELVVHISLVEIALGNLLRNAARHASGSAVCLHVAEQAGQALFVVEDEGRGVPSDQREAVFGRFAKGTTTRDRRGLGLGLPLAREVARRHGGDCVLAEAPGGGLQARLTLALPR